MKIPPIGAESFHADEKPDIFFPVALRPVVGPWPSLTEVSQSYSDTPQKLKTLKKKNHNCLLNFLLILSQ